MIRKDSYPVPAIFRMLQEEGEIAEHVMYNTFNMGIGMVMALDSADAEQAVKVLREAGEQAFVIGSVEAGERKAEIIG